MRNSKRNSAKLSAINLRKKNGNLAKILEEIFGKPRREIPEDTFYKFWKDFRKEFRKTIWEPKNFSRKPGMKPCRNIRKKLSIFGRNIGTISERVLETFPGYLSGGKPWRNFSRKNKNNSGEPPGNEHT